MKNKNLRKTSILMVILSLCILLNSVSSVNAFSDELYNNLNFFDKMEYNFYHQGTFTVVNGVTCGEDYFGEYISGEGKDVICPTVVNRIDNKGCALEIFDGRYNGYLGQKKLNPGERYFVSYDLTYEMYYCTNVGVGCECSGEKSGGCGGWTCNEDEMYRYRTCTETTSGGCYDNTFFWEKKCVKGYKECTYECYAGDVKCEGTTYFECSSNKWSNKGEVSEKCGITDGGTTTGKKKVGERCGGFVWGDCEVGLECIQEDLPAISGICKTIGETGQYHFEPRDGVCTAIKGSGENLCDPNAETEKKCGEVYCAEGQMCQDNKCVSEGRTDNVKAIPESLLKEKTKDELEDSKCSRTSDCEEGSKCVAFADLPKDSQNKLASGIFNLAEDGICVIEQKTEISLGVLNEDAFDGVKWWMIIAGIIIILFLIPKGGK